MRSEKPAMRSEKPAIRSEKPAMSSEKPVMRSEKPVVCSEKPVVRSEKPAVRSEKLVSTTRTLTEAIRDDSVDLGTCRTYFFLFSFGCVSSERDIACWHCFLGALAFAGHKRQRKPNGQYFNDTFDVKGKGTDLINNRNGTNTACYCVLES